MKRTLIALALAACAGAPVFAQQADYCSRSGYVEGVASDRDFDHRPCDTRAVPRVNGVPQQPRAQAAQPTARPGYNLDQQAQQRYYDQQNRYYDAQNQRYYEQRSYDPRNYDPRYMGNRDSRDWERYRDGRYYYGARGPEWRRGGYVPREYMGRQYWVHDWRAHRLPPPPYGHRWVQVGGDYVLVQESNGIIAQLIFGG